MESEKFYKVLDEGQLSCHGGYGRWFKGSWRRVEGPLVPCRNGLHLCRREDLVRWLGEQIWIAEARGKRIDTEYKVVVSEARIVERLKWSRKIAVSFACDCADRALATLKTPDTTSVEAIRVARAWVRGEATDEECSAAASAAYAAYSAAAAAATAAAATTRAAYYAAAHSDAYSAAYAAYAADAAAAAYDAYAASYAASYAAAYGATAGAAERAWQTDRLFEYLEGRREP